MDKNLLLAFALSMGVYVGWAYFVERQIPQQPPAVQTSVPATTTSAAKADAPAKVETMEKKMETLPPGRDTELTGQDWTAKINSRGAAISSFKYKGPLGYVELVLKPETGLFSTWRMLDFKETRTKDGLAFTAQDPKGLRITKTFKFAEAGQLGSLAIELTNPGSSPADVAAWTTELGPGLGTVPSEIDENPTVWRAVGLVSTGGKDRLKQLKDGGAETNWNWIGVDNRYFLAAIVKQPNELTKARLEHEPMIVQKKGWFHFLTKETSPTTVQAPRLVIEAQAMKIAPATTSKIEIPFYLGPKEYISMKELGLGLERSVDFGWFDSLGRFTLKSLQWLQGITGNYGWSIVILTLVLQIVLFPLTSKSLKAANAMKKVQPEIAKLQQKYQSDPKRLNTEMMQLYKAKGVNPLGGCLPMLVQLPVFVALFNSLRNAWELHGAKWTFIRDLSSKDPYYVLPVLMGGVMFFQNKTNPAMTSDPMQANMMKWMPILFTFMFMNFPAGLVLYWLTNSLMSFGQQMAMRRYAD